MDKNDPRLLYLRRFIDRADLASLELPEYEFKLMLRSLRALTILVDGMEQCDLAFNRGFIDALAAGSDMLTASNSGKIELARHVQNCLARALEATS